MHVDVQRVGESQLLNPEIHRLDDRKQLRFGEVKILMVMIRLIRNGGVYKLNKR